MRHALSNEMHFISFLLNLFQNYNVILRDVLF